MIEQTKAERIRATIEEELGTFRAFADLPATEIEVMSARILRAIGSLVSEAAAAEPRAA